jgi:hypothetical protein
VQPGAEHRVPPASHAGRREQGDADIGRRRIDETIGIESISKGFLVAVFTDILQDSFSRVADELPQLLDDLPLAALHWQPDPNANPIGWLAWHIGRCEDVQMAELMGSEQVWVTGGWTGRFQLPYKDDDLGYGHSAEQVRAFRVEDPALLSSYYDDVHARTVTIVQTLTERDFTRVIDRRWDPPVTVGVRVVSVVNDVTQHLGQLAYLRGLWERTTP